MFEIKDKVENLLDNMDEIAKNYYDLTMLKAVEKGSKLASTLVISSLVAAILFFAFLFAGIGAGFLLGRWLGSPVWGFFIIAGFLLLILILILLLKGRFLKPMIRNLFIKNLYD